MRRMLRRIAIVCLAASTLGLVATMTPRVAEVDAAVHLATCGSLANDAYLGCWQDCMNSGGQHSQCDQYGNECWQATYDACCADGGC